MPETLFIADIHLHPSQPAILTRFLNFLATRARQAEALYILGDLFEAWIGDDDDEPVYQTVLVALRTATTDGLPIYVMRGNRDFLLGTGFTAQTGCQLLADSVVIDVYDVPTLLLHGDTLCTLDTDYQAFRQQVRNPHWQTQFLAYPLSQRRLLAQQARTQSQAYTRPSAMDILEVAPAAVIDALATHSVYRLIHGHTHRPAIHQLSVNGQLAYRYVVSDWFQDEVKVMSCTPNACQLMPLPI